MAVLTEFVSVVSGNYANDWQFPTTKKVIYPNVLQILSAFFQEIFRNSSVFLIGYPVIRTVAEYFKSL